MLHLVIPTPACRRPAALRAPVAAAVLAGAWLVSACQAQPMANRAAGSPATAAASDADLQRRIVEGIGPAACQADGECRTLPVGAKACGGPASWLAYSTRSSDGAQLLVWSDALAARQRQQQQARGQASTCSVVPDPGAACVAGRCTIQRSGGAGGALAR